MPRSDRSSKQTKTKRSTEQKTRRARVRGGEGRGRGRVQQAKDAQRPLAKRGRTNLDNREAPPNDESIIRSVLGATASDPARTESLRQTKSTHHRTPRHTPTAKTPNAKRSAKPTSPARKRSAATKRRPTPSTRKVARQERAKATGSVPAKRRH